jgi:hypothetical protein
MWITGFGHVSQFIYAFIPENLPINYYLCTGLEPPKAIEKVNLYSNPLLILTILSTALQVL